MSGSLEDVKPKVSLIEDTKPKSSIEDTKPKLSALAGNLTQSYQVIINAGQPIGLLLALTYPTIGTVTQFSEVGLDH